MRAQPDQQPARPPAEADEIARIRAVYEHRDRGGARSGPIQEAYRRLNAERLEATRRTLQRLLTEPHPRLLDVGCGGGHDLSFWHRAGWPTDRLAGTDLVPERLEAARVACPGADLRLSRGTTIPFADDSVDVATAVTVFSSILDPEVRRALFADMERDVRPSGVILVYDFVVRKPTNATVIGMPLRRLTELGGRPDGSERLSPVLQVVAASAAIDRRLADAAMRLAPRTHRLTYWRVPAGSHSATSLR